MKSVMHVLRMRGVTGDEEVASLMGIGFIGFGGRCFFKARCVAGVVDEEDDVGDEEYDAEAEGESFLMADQDEDNA